MFKNKMIVLENNNKLTLKSIKFHLEEKNLKKALENTKKLIKFKKLKSSNEKRFYIFFSKIIYLFNNYTLIYIKQKLFKLSKDLILETLYLLKDKEYLYWYKLEISTLNVYTIYYKKLKNYNKSIKLIEKSLNIANFYKDNENLIIIYNNFSAIYSKMNKYKRAYDCSKFSTKLCSELIENFDLNDKEFYENFKESLKTYIVSWINKAKIEKYLKLYKEFEISLQKVEGICNTYNFDNLFKSKINDLKIRKYMININDKYKKNYIKNFNNKTINNKKNYNLSQYYNNSYLIKTKNKTSFFSKLKIKKNKNFVLNNKFNKLSNKFFIENEKLKKNYKLINKLTTNKEFFKFKDRNKRSIRLSVNYFNKLKLNPKMSNKIIKIFKNNKKEQINVFLKNVIKIQSIIRKKLSDKKRVYYLNYYNTLNFKGKKLFNIYNKKQIFNYIIYLKDYNAIEVRLFKINHLFLERIFIINEIFNNYYINWINNMNTSLYIYKKNVNFIFKKIINNIEIKYYNKYEIVLNLNEIKKNNFVFLQELNTELTISSCNFSIENLMINNNNDDLENKFKISKKVIKSTITIQKNFRLIRYFKNYRQYIKFNSLIIDFGLIIILNKEFKFIVLYRYPKNNYFIIFITPKNKLLNGIIIERLNFNLKKIIYSLYFNKKKFIYKDFMFYNNDKNIELNQKEKILIKNFITKKNKLFIQDKKKFNLTYYIKEINFEKVNLKFIGKKLINNFILLLFYNNENRFFDIRLFKKGYNILLDRLFYYIPMNFKNIKELLYDCYKNLKIIKNKNKFIIKFKQTINTFSLNIAQNKINNKIIRLQKNFKNRKLLIESKICSNKIYNTVKVLFLNVQQKIIIKIFDENEIFLLKEIIFNISFFDFNKIFLKNVFFLFIIKKNSKSYKITVNDDNLIKNFKKKNKLKYINKKYEGLEIEIKSELKLQNNEINNEETGFNYVLWKFDKNNFNKNPNNYHNWIFDYKIFDTNKFINIKYLEFFIKKIIKKYIFKFVYYKTNIKSDLYNLDDFWKDCNFRIKKYNSYKNIKSIKNYKDFKKIRTMKAFK